jgi:hypothetical protein
MKRKINYLEETEVDFYLTVYFKILNNDYVNNMFNGKK